jgi:hypothetical protein
MTRVAPSARGDGLLHCGILIGSMSAMGHKQTSRDPSAMSALPLKADIDRRAGRVR